MFMLYASGCAPADRLFDKTMHCVIGDIG